MLDIALKSSVVLVLAWVVTSAASSPMPAAMRHAVWALALMAALAMPAIARRSLLARAAHRAGRDACRRSPADCGLAPEWRRRGTPYAEAGLPEAAAPRPRLSVVTPSPGVRGSEASPRGRRTARWPRVPRPGGSPKSAPPGCSRRCGRPVSACSSCARRSASSGRGASRRARTPGRAPWMPVARALARSIGAPRHALPALRGVSMPDGVRRDAADGRAAGRGRRVAGRARHVGAAPRAGARAAP